MRITGAECLCSLSYPAHTAHAPYYIAICGLSGSTILLPHYLRDDAIFGGGGGIVEHKMCFDFLYNFCPKYSSF